MPTVNFLATSIILVWAIWSALSWRVKDGIVGKMIFFMIALSAWAILLSEQAPSRTAETTLHACLAAYCVRAVVMKYAWHWFVKTVLCKNCPMRRADDH